MLGDVQGVVLVVHASGVAVKITYLDRAKAEWQLEYFTDANKTATRKVTCGNSGAVKTVTFILKDACFPGQGYKGMDLQIRALKGDAVIRLVRVIRLNPKTGKSAN